MVKKLCEICELEKLDVLKGNLWEEIIKTGNKSGGFCNIKKCKKIDDYIFGYYHGCYNTLISIKALYPELSELAR